ncbi:hypothetical protein NC981_09510 [Leptolyngbya sp. DQ-M1]|uniref:hypothetical protein n=1 Tax=Leptolyngbya sp. DQ-M1 TaxID=2933920 RepID=UPI0032971D14
MIDALSERVMRKVQWTLTIGWLILIISLFYDPISAQLTAPSSTWSPLRINQSSYQCPITNEEKSSIDWGQYSPGTADSRCPSIQNRWVVNHAYPLGTHIFWASVSLAAPLLLIFGHSGWRRICPLSFLSQLPKALGLQQNRKIKNESWLGRYYWVLQFGILYLGLTLRILLVNSSRLGLGVFLLFTIASAMLINLIFKGKTWCHYFCPFAPVQKILTGTGGLLEKTKSTRSSIPQSMCRTIDLQQHEVSACVGCKTACSDIDLERSYWSELFKPGRRFAQYGYVGLVAGFYGYYFLYSGDWDYYFSGVWTYESDVVEQWWQPGLYLLKWAVPIPKVIAAPLVLEIATVSSYCLGVGLEQLYRRCRQQLGHSISTEIARRQCYSVASYIAFNLFYWFGGRLSLEILPEPLSWGTNIGILLASSVWLGRALWYTVPPKSSKHVSAIASETGTSRKSSLGIVAASVVSISSLARRSKLKVHKPESSFTPVAQHQIHDVRVAQLLSSKR